MRLYNAVFVIKLTEKGIFFSFDLALTTHLRIVFLNSMYIEKLEPQVLFRLLCGQGGLGLDGT